MTPDRRREPLFKIPTVVLVLLAAMAAILAWQGTLSASAETTFIARFAFVPGRLTFALDPMGVMQRIATWNTSEVPAVRRQAASAALFLGQGRVSPWTLLTYSFLHGGWTHLALNGLWMVAFGTPVARRFGTVRFLLFMAVTAVCGALAHWICYPYGFAPVIGASAAVSGLMGAALRYMFQSPRSSDDQRTAPALSLVGVFRERRALSFIVAWFVTNSLFGAGSMSFGLSDAPVAWQAHVGGFLAGLLMFPWFDPAPQVLPSISGSDEPTDPAPVPQED